MHKHNIAFINEAVGVTYKFIHAEIRRNAWNLGQKMTIDKTPPVEVFFTIHGWLVASADPNLNIPNLSRLSSVMVAAPGQYLRVKGVRCSSATEFVARRNSLSE